MFLKRGTPSKDETEFPDWYIQFQSKALTQLPRPGKHFNKEIAQEWLHDGNRLKSALHSILLPAPEIRIWQTVKLGIHRTVEAYRGALKERGVKFGMFDPNEMLEDISIVAKPVEVALVMLSPADIGFTDIIEIRDLYRRATLLGLESCLGEVAPAACLQCPIQRKRTTVAASIPSKMFELSRDADGSILLGSSMRMYESNRVTPEEMWIFARGK